MLSNSCEIMKTLIEAQTKCKQFFHSSICFKRPIPRVFIRLQKESDHRSSEASSLDLCSIALSRLCFYFCMVFEFLQFQISMYTLFACLLACEPHPHRWLVHQEPHACMLFLIEEEVCRKKVDLQSWKILLVSYTCITQILGNEKNMN